MSRRVNDAVTPARVLFAALIGLSGISVHLIAELFGLGLHADALLILSACHIPLGVLLLTDLVALAAVGRGIARQRNRKRAVAGVMRALPSGGRGLRFLATAFAGEMLVFALTEASEGIPIDRGDLGCAVIAALVASVVVALLLAWSQRRLIAGLGELFVFFAGAPHLEVAASWLHGTAEARVWRCRSIVFAGSRRPPPAALLN